MGEHYRARRDYWEFVLKEADFSKIISYKNLNKNEKRQLFCKYVDVINVETSTFCNRKCNYCPLSVVDRKQQLIDEQVFEKGIDELQLLGYQNRIALNLYNEPLYDSKLLSHIAYVHKKLPDSYIQMNSNGDRLDREMLDKLRKSGLNQILVTLHPNNNKYLDNERKEAVRAFLSKNNLIYMYSNMTVIPGKNITVDETVDGMRLIVCCNNWEIFGNDRGGCIKKLSISGRNQPCCNPYREVNIACNGDYKPCCNIYFDMDDDYGNISEFGILDFYFSDKMIGFRRKLLDFSAKYGECGTCNTEDNAKRESDIIRKKILTEET